MKGVVAKAAFFCDDVRQENNGKLLFIGVYNSELNVVDIPTVIRLYLVMTLTNDEPRTYNFEIEASLDGAQLFGIEGELESVQATTAFAPLRLPQFRIEKFGDLTMKFREKKHRWQEVASIKISKRQN